MENTKAETESNNKMRYGRLLGFAASAVLPHHWISECDHSTLVLDETQLVLRLNDDKKVHSSGFQSDHFYCVNSNTSTSMNCGVFYYEVEVSSVKDEQAHCFVGYSEYARLSKLTIKELVETQIYFGFNGSKISVNHSQVVIGPSLAHGDTLGCGIDYHKKQIFFTHNGKFIGYNYRIFMNNIYYAVAGIAANGVTLKTNFGKLKFVYDIEQYIDSKVDNCFSKAFNFRTEKLNEKIIRHIYNYFVYQGYADSAKALNNTLRLGKKFRHKECEFRKEVTTHIKNFNAKSARQLIHENCKNFEEKYQALSFELKCLEFVDACHAVSYHSDSICRMSDENELLPQSHSSVGSNYKDSFGLSIDKYKSFVKNEELMDCFKNMFDNPLSINRPSLSDQDTSLISTVYAAGIDLKSFFDLHRDNLGNYNEIVKELLLLSVYCDWKNYPFQRYISNFTRDLIIKDINLKLLRFGGAFESNQSFVFIGNIVGNFLEKLTKFDKWREPYNASLLVGFLQEIKKTL